jgi:uncharacterized lipoprotein YmbA
MRVRLGLLAIVLASASTCVSFKRSPEARYFVLRSPADTLAAPKPVASKGFVGVQTVRLPDHLDRPQLVSWTAAGEVRIEELLRWGEPLNLGFTRILAENLQAVLPDHAVGRAPWQTTPRSVVVTELRAFGLQSDNTVRLEASWSLVPNQGVLPLARGKTSLSRGPFPLASGRVDPNVEVEAMGQLVAELAREIGAAVKGLPPEE